MRRVCAESLCEGLGIDPEKRKQSPWEWFLSVGNRCLCLLRIRDSVRWESETLFVRNRRLCSSMKTCPNAIPLSASIRWEYVRTFMSN